MRHFLTVIFALSALSGLAQDTVRTFTLGDTAISLVVHRGPHPGPLYYNMHDDEHTSVIAAISVIREQGGTLWELVHTGERNIPFHVDSTLYRIDPNRIYTDAGIWREIRLEFKRDSVDLIAYFLRLQDSLVNVGCLPQEPVFTDYVRDTVVDLSDTAPVEPDTMVFKVDSPAIVNLIPFPFSALDSVAFSMVRTLSDELLTFLQIDSQRLVIALHNNREQGYSLASYRIDSVYEDEALSIYVGWHPDPDDFYFVTERRIFEALQPNHYHIVLQDNARMTDDGSLSVYCGQRGIPYVNVEAQHRHTEDQVKMLHTLLERLGLARVRNNRK